MRLLSRLSWWCLLLLTVLSCTRIGHSLSCLACVYHVLSLFSVPVCHRLSHCHLVCYSVPHMYLLCAIILIFKYEFL